MTTTNPDGAQSASGGQSRSGAVGPNSHNAHTRGVSQRSIGVVGPSLADPAQVRLDRHSIAGGVGDPSTVNAQRRNGNQSSSGVDGPNSHDVQVSGEGQNHRGVVGPTPTDPPMASSIAYESAAGPSAPAPPGASIASPTARTSAACSKVQTPPAAPIDCTATNVEAAPLADPFLALAADVLDDLERVRIANENRLRQLTRTATDADGEERGFGLDETHPDVARLAALVEALAKNEHQATLNLARQMRAHPLGAWVKRTSGVGEKQAARLLASIGDPSWNDLHDRPRTLRELYSYCGYGDAAAQVRRRGEKANWDATGKMRAHLVAVSCVKATTSPYRAVYDQGREKYADALHPGECKRCGPAGKPAQPGTPLSAGHQHARALRLVAKAILRDLWREARRIHGYTDDEEQAA